MDNYERLTFEEEFELIGERYLNELKAECEGKKREEQTCKCSQYLTEDLKNNLKYWNSQKERLAAFKPQDMVDLLILGNDRAGKSSWLKALGGEGVDGGGVSDLQGIEISQGKRISVREVSACYAKSWTGYKAESRITLLVMRDKDIGSGIIQALNMLSEPQLPFILLLSGLDVSQHEPIVNLPLPPGIILTAVSVFSKNHVQQVKDHIKQLLSLFGDETPRAIIPPPPPKQTQPSPTKSKRFCC